MDPIPGRFLDVLQRASIEEGALLEAVMSESIPLRAALSIESQDIIVHRSRRLVLHGVFKCRPSETRGGHTIERPIC